MIRITLSAIIIGEKIINSNLREGGNLIAAMALPALASIESEVCAR